MTPEERDELLGAALRELEVPDHEPGFELQLRARLDAEKPAARTPEPAPRRAVRARRAFTPRGGWSWRPLIAGFALALVLLAVIFSRESGRLAAPGGFGTAPATAAELGARVERAIAQARSIAGTFIDRERYGVAGLPFHVNRTKFLITAAGDERLTAIGPGSDYGIDTAYRAATATQTQLVHGPQGIGGVITTGMASGLPDGGPDDRILGRALAGVVPALRAAGDRQITTLRYNGRPAWQLRTPVAINKLGGPGGSPDRLEFIVDRATGLPLRVRETLRGRLIAERQITDLRINVPALPSAFRLDVPRKPTPIRIDNGYRRVTLARAGAITGYAPLAPSTLPNGYRRAETNVAHQSGPTGNEGGNPISRDVVSTAYRSGLRLVIVTTRRRGPGTPPCSPAQNGGGPCWADPLGAGEGIAIPEQPLHLREHALARSRARIVIVPRAIPHIWALTDNLVVTISGDLSRDELIAAAESLQPTP